MNAMSFASGAPAKVWVLTDRRPGNVNQCLGVAEALGVPFEEKSLDYTWAVRLDNRLRGASLIGIAASSRAQLVAPWPELVIAAGRRSAPVARYIKRASGGQTRLVQIMNPGHACDEFDLIALPDHDRFTPSDNILSVTGAPHRITPERLAAEAEAWRERFEALPKPWVGLLIGAGCGRWHLGASAVIARVQEVAEQVRAAGGTLLATTSRRTPRSMIAALSDVIGGGAFVHRWRRHDENPYLGLLALSDALVVTGDSVSMCSEATATGRPVFVLPPPLLSRPPHRRFLDRLLATDLVRPWTGQGVSFSAPSAAGGRSVSFNAASTIVEAIRQRFGLPVSLPCPVSAM